MFNLLTFTPFQPTPGLAIWSFIIFVLFWILMGKYAFKPIAEALTKRENDIQNSIDQAKKAREEMLSMKAENEKILAEAREERAKIIQEAKDMKTSMINDAKDKAKDEATKIMTNAKNDIENQKKAAMTEVKNQVGGMAIEIAEKIIKKQLAGNADQEAFVKSLVNEVNLN